MYQPNQTDTDRNYDVLIKLINNSVENVNQYDGFVYAYNKSKRFFILTVWSNYVFLYNLAFDKFALCLIHNPQKKGNWVIREFKHFTNDDISYFAKKIDGQHELRLTDDSRYKFYLQPYIPTKRSAKYLLPIIQEDKVYKVLGKIEKLPDKRTKSEYLKDNILVIFIGVAMIVFSIYIYFELKSFEEGTGEARMNALFHLVYKLGGKIAVSALLGLIGILILISIFNSMNKKGRKKNKDL
ncbi:MAG: hypothetical protein ABI760_25175 [Ferruginibacter sp.]